MFFDNEKSITFKAIKILESQGINKNAFYKWKLYHSENFYKFISQAEISLDIAMKRYENNIKKYN